MPNLSPVFSTASRSPCSRAQWLDGCLVHYAFLDMPGTSVTICCSIISRRTGGISLKEASKQLAVLFMTPTRAVTSVAFASIAIYLASCSYQLLNPNSYHIYSKSQNIYTVNQSTPNVQWLSVQDSWIVAAGDHGNGHWPSPCGADVLTV